MVRPPWGNARGTRSCQCGRRAQSSGAVGAPLESTADASPPCAWRMTRGAAQPTLPYRRTTPASPPRRRSLGRSPAGCPSATILTSYTCTTRTQTQFIHYNANYSMPSHTRHPVTQEIPAPPPFHLKENGLILLLVQELADALADTPLRRFPRVAAPLSPCCPHRTCLRPSPGAAPPSCLTTASCPR